MKTSVTPPSHAKSSFNNRGVIASLALGLAYLIQWLGFEASTAAPAPFSFLQHAISWLLAAPGRREMVAAGGYLLAMALFAWAVAPLRTNENGRHQESPRPLGREDRFLGGGMVAVIGLALGNIVRFAIRGEDALTRALWLGSLLALGLLSLLAAQPWTSWKPKTGSWQRRHVLGLLAILGGAAWLRFHLLAAIPQDFHGDMASMGLQARAILNGQTPEIFRTGWADIPMLGFYPSLLGLKFVANSIFGLNFVPALEGVLSILALYLLVWRVHGSHRLAALSAAILAVNIPHIHFSRLAAYMDPWPWILFAFLLLAHGLQVRRLWPFPLAGALMGFSLQMYYSGRVAMVILLAGGLYLWWVNPKRTWEWRKELLAAVALWSMGLVIAMGPLLVFFWQHPAPFLSRSRDVFLFHEPVMAHLQRKYGVDTPLAVLWEQVRRSVLMFNASHDTSTQFGYPHPLFTGFISPLIGLGIAVSIRFLRRPGLGLGVIWLFLIMILGSVLTNNAPFWPRLVGILPVAAYMAALAVEFFLQTWRLDGPVSLWDPTPSATVLMTLTMGLVLLGHRNWTAYFLATSNNARPAARIGRYLDGLPDAIHACSFSRPYRLQVREIQFLAWPHSLLDLGPQVTGPLLEACPGPNRVWILGPNEASQRVRVQRRWPQGQLRPVYDKARRVVFQSFLVTAETHGESQEPSPPSSSAYLPDGTLFEPSFVYQGNFRSQPEPWRVGPVEVKEGGVTLTVGPIAGQDGVFDYVEFLDTQGHVYHFEAEDLNYEGDVSWSEHDGLDNRWWLQSYPPFSGGAGLVARKGELVPALRTTISLPPGVYSLTIGTFTGDPANGAFALGVAIRGGPFQAP